MYAPKGEMTAWQNTWQHRKLPRPDKEWPITVGLRNDRDHAVFKTRRRSVSSLAMVLFLVRPETALDGVVHEVQ